MEFGSTIAILFASSAMTAASPGAELSSKPVSRDVEAQPRPAPAAVAESFVFRAYSNRESAGSFRKKSGK